MFFTIISFYKQSENLDPLKENITFISKRYTPNKLFLEDEQNILIKNFSKFNNITLQEFNINNEQIIQFDKIREFCIENNIKYIKTDQINDI